MIKRTINNIKVISKDLSETQLITNEEALEVGREIFAAIKKLDIIYCVYEYNPYAKRGEPKWEEIAATRNPDTCKDIAESLVRAHDGQIDLRYDYKNKLYQIKNDYHSYLVEGE